MSKEHRMRGGVVLFDLRQAETPDDAAIEKLIQRLVGMTFKQAERADMQYADVVSAAIELAARVGAAPIATSGRGFDESARGLASHLVDDFRMRLISRMKGERPGDSIGDSIGDTRGSA